MSFFKLFITMFFAHFLSMSFLLNLFSMIHFTCLFITQNTQDQEQQETDAFKQ